MTALLQVSDVSRNRCHMCPCYALLGRVMHYIFAGNACMAMHCVNNGAMLNVCMPVDEHVCIYSNAVFIAICIKLNE